MSFHLPQNPGLGGLDELTTSEEFLVQSIAALGDPNADRILFWDDSAGQFQYLTIGSGLSISGTTITATSGSGTVADIKFNGATIVTGATAIDFINAQVVNNAGVAEITTNVGNITKVGTPVNNQIGVWTGDGTLEGDTALTFDTATDTLSVAASGKIAFGAVNILDDTAGTTTLSNIDALDATTVATIESAIDTLANLTTIQGRTVTLADAGANAIFGWDDVAGAYENLTQGEVKAIIGDAAADGSTKGVATFTANDFNASSGNISIDYTNGQKATDTQPGFLTELATASETTTGTDATRAVTPDGLAGSDYGKRVCQVLVSDPTGSAITTGDGKAGFRISSALNGYNLVGVAASLGTVSSSGAVTVMVRRSRRTNATTRSNADMLSTAITIDQSEFDTEDAATAAVINGSNDDVQTGDHIYIDIDGAGTGAKGLIVELVFQLP